MPIDFPNSPSVGAIHTVGGIRWQYDGTAWNVIEGDAIQTVETKTDNYTLLPADAGKIIQVNKSTGVTITVNGDLNLAVGDRIDLIQTGAGQVTVSASGATVTGTPSTGGTLTLRAQYSAASLICVASDSYILAGDLGGTPVAQDGYFAVNLTGGWNAGNPTTATSGTSFTAPSTGLYLVTFGGGTYTTSAGQLHTLTAHLNGSATAAVTSRHYLNEANVHHAFVPQVATVTLNSGTNYVWIKQAGTGVASDGNDFGFFSGIKVGS